MITLRRVKDPVTLPCPYCAAPIATVDEAAGQIVRHGKSLHGEPDLIEDMHQRLTPAQRVPNGFQCLVEVGEARCCQRNFFFVEAIMVNRNLDPSASEADSDFISRYFFYNGGRGQPTHFMASRGKREWPVQRFESSYGPVLHHYFGPFKWIEKWDMWSGPEDGKVDSWEYAHRVLLALWDDLQALTTATK